MKFIFKNDHYETDFVLDIKNCKVLQSNSEWTFIKLENYKQLEYVKREINGLINRNHELYHDCKQIVKVGHTFEEVIKVKTNGFELKNENVNLQLALNVSIGKSSYGPLFKINGVIENKNENISFLDEELTDSDEDLDTHFEKFKNIKNIKKVKNIKKDKN
jgi:hypothetical protein